MSYKTKISIAIGIGFLFIIVMMVVMVVFVQNNNKSDDNQNVVATEEKQIEEPVDVQEEINFDDFYSFAIRDEDDGYILYGLSEDLTATRLFDVYSEEMNYTAMYYYDGLIYLLYNNNDESYDVYSVDSSQIQVLVLSTQENYLSSFEIYDGAIYFLTNGSVVYQDDTNYSATENYIYRYDMETQEESEIVYAEENTEIEDMEIDKENGIIYYMKNEFSEDYCLTSICELNLETDDSSTIIQVEAKGQELILNNNIIAFKFITGEVGDYYSQHYVYNIDNQSYWELANIEVTFDEMKNYTAFSEDYIIFSDGEKIKITDYEGNVLNEALYEIQDENPIYDIMMLNSNILQIRIWDAEIGLGDTIKATYRIDFDSLTIDEADENYRECIRK